VKVVWQQLRGWKVTHLFIGPIPVVGSGFCLLLLIFGLLLHSTRVLRIGLFLISLITLFAVWAYLSGSAAADAALKQIPSAQPTVDAHQEAATTALVVMLLTGVLSFAGLIIRGAGRSFPSWYTLMVTLLLIIALALLIGAAGLAQRISRPWLAPPGLEQESQPPADSSSAMLLPPVLTGESSSPA
jgi:hypothetical protein